MSDYPLVYDGTAYTKRLHPIQCSPRISLSPLSTVNMTVPETDEIANLDWVQITTPDGETMYFRVASVSTDAVNGTKNVYLEHGACTLGDIVVPDSSQAKTTTSSSAHGADLVEYMEDKTDTITNILTYILGKQGTGGRWTVGTVECTRTIYIELGNASLMDSLSTMMQYIPDYQLEFKQNSATDWRVNVKARPTTPVCEARLGRNIVDCEVSYDTKDTCTRVYCEGVTGGYMDSANTSLYGIRSKTQSLNKDLSAAQKEAIVSAFLANHDHPIVSVSIKGRELKRITGLDIDKFPVGSVCRMAIPSIGMTVDEVVIEKSYQDMYGDPENVDISLANATPDLAIAIAAVTSHGGGGMAGKLDKAEKEQKRYETHFEQTDKYFKLIATDSQWDEMGEATVTAYGQIVLTATSFEAVVQNIGADGTITAASICLAINDSGSQAYIHADHITLDGAVIEATGQFSAHAIVVPELDCNHFYQSGSGNDFGVNAEAYFYNTVYAEAGIVFGYDGSGTLTGPTLDVVNAYADNLYVKDGNTDRKATWQSKTIVTGVSYTAPVLYRSDSKDFLYIENGQEYTWTGRIVTGWSDGDATPITDTIYYLGRT